MSQRLPDIDDDQALLDAARDAIMDFGVRRTTLTDVARRAGVSRMTIYRRHSDIASIISDLMTRDFGAAIAQAAKLAKGHSGRERLLDEVLLSVEALIASPLFQRILDVDPELVLPYLTVRRGAIQQLAIIRLIEMVVQGQADGSIRAADPKLMAQAIELSLRGYVGASRSDSPKTVRDLGAEFKAMLDGYLTPAPQKATAQADDQAMVNR